MAPRGEQAGAAKVLLDVPRELPVPRPNPMVVVHLGVVNIAHQPALNRRTDRHGLTAVAHLEADTGLNPGGLDRVTNRERAGPVDPNGLLDNQVLARLRRRNRLLGVERVGRADIDNVDGVVGEEVAKLRVDLERNPVLSTQRQRVQRPAGANRHDLRTRYALERLDMRPRHPAHPHNPNAKVLHADSLRQLCYNWSMKHWIAVGHRGSPGHFPANTLRSFQYAVALGCEMVECDIRRAADGVLVLAHDAHIGALEIAATDSRALAAQHDVPTLTELIAWAAASGVAVMADMKVEGDGVEEAVVAALAELPPTQKLVPGAGPESRARFRALDPTLPLSLSHPGPLDDSAFEALLPRIDTIAVTWHHSILTPERVARLQERGLQVFAWTVDDPERMQQLLAVGVDGIISNNTEALSRLKVGQGE